MIDDNLAEDSISIKDGADMNVNATAHLKRHSKPKK